MKRVSTLLIITSLLAATLSSIAADKKPLPEPRVITPGKDNSPPSDAIVLFDGSDLSAWEGKDGAAPSWKIEDGAMVVAKGGISTKQKFGDIQLHVEWATPTEIKGKGQGRGNSGVYVQGRYEIQVLDSYNNKTYPDGQAGAFYLHSPPLVNASRKPGEWQTYDIIFRAPRQKDDGTVSPGSFTVLHNGVLIQNETPIPGKATTSAQLKGIAPKGPIFLQDHNNPVRYRNIWVREL